MKKAIIGKKIGMTQVFDIDNNVVPVTVIEVGPCVISQKKTIETDGYNSIQMGYGDVKLKKLTKPLKGHFDKSNVAPKNFLKEFRFEDTDNFNVGDIIKADIFSENEQVDIRGKNKGKGFSGVIKRWNFRRLKMSHGTGPVVRKGGSIGACSTPSRVFKGKKMAGHLGNENVTIQNLRVVKIDIENNLIAIKGAIPGPNGSIITIHDSVKIKKKED
ncbi:MAG: 50S ribosomal protein L3 [Candidatus Paraimprobicoccus trichonymphae]|uniref:Large ribosomal subunit protein uL3 n=1 Tax=Candidatus Paraimprobicoccus trichonymphae TaxID=3033793 RepID=A0AA48IC09_9FIRM|nr:MAG: 50S ribosomal protein L3 [Candidatus Paraimprobicoccus trichonymphae]